MYNNDRIHLIKIMSKKDSKKPDGYKLPKSPTGIEGFDEITKGGLPKGRPSLIAGGAGSGKTLFSAEFLINGATKYNEPGVFMAFEETADDLKKNVKSLGYDLQDLIDKKLLYIDHVKIERNEIEETGEYDLEGLFIRLDLAINAVGAKRVVLDTIESLFSGLNNTAVIRAEIRRLFHWLKEKEVTVIITGERDNESAITRQGLEEYVSDAVITLDHRIANQISTRRLRIVKYRGSTHGTNEYPFLIDAEGFTVLPVTSLRLDHDVSKERISTGVKKLDQMLGGYGVYRGSSVLYSGTAGTGKTSLAAHAALAACRKGERILYFAFEESPQQIIRNMKSINVDLEPYVKKGLLNFHAARPTIFGLEMHLVTMHKLIGEFDPSIVIVDPISNLISISNPPEANSMLTRLIDFLKSKQKTAIFTSLTGGEQMLEQTEVGISSLIDTWILVKTIELSGERNRGLYILKSRGMGHSNQIREFVITDKGIDLLEVYIGPGGVLTGTARISQEAREKALGMERRLKIERRQREIQRKRKALEVQIKLMKSEFEAEEEEINRTIEQEEQEERIIAQERTVMGELRGGSKK